MYKTQDHVELHFDTYLENNPIPYPDSGCEKDDVILKGHIHFMSHAARAHGYDIFRRGWSESVQPCVHSFVGRVTWRELKPQAPT